jgi:hypothetical protein
MNLTANSTARATPTRPARRTPATLRPVGQDRPRAAAQAALAAQLTRLLNTTAQQATAMNWQALRCVAHDSAEDVTPWQLSWRAYVICTTTARDIARRSADYVFAQRELLWQAAESFTAQLDSIEAQRLAALRARLHEVSVAAETFIAATDAALRELSTLTQES